jgi:aminopeptidase
MHAVCSFVDVIDASTDPYAAGKIQFNLHNTSSKLLLQAVTAHLELYNFLLKTSPPSVFDPWGTAGVPKKPEISTNTNSADLDRGVVYANAQNLARTVSSWNGIAS